MMPKLSISPSATDVFQEVRFPFNSERDTKIELAHCHEFGFLGYVIAVSIFQTV
jgi:hypothetical protein